MMTSGKTCRPWLLLFVCILVGLFPATGLGQVGSIDQQSEAIGPLSIDGPSQDLAPVYTDKYGLVFEGANWPGNSGSVDQHKTNEIISTGVKWVLLDNLWFYSEPTAPTPTCQSGQGPHCYCGPKAACHNYNFTALDQVVNALNAAGIQVGLRFLMHPTWAGGQTCAGFSPPCGAILSNHMTTFSNNLYDLAYNMATRYKGKVAFWAIWNEPNIAYAFSPQDLNAGGGYLTNEYMDLIQFPAHAAIAAVIPGAITVGPELATPNGGGNAKYCDYYNHCMYLLGQGEWEDAMLRFFDTYFQTFTIHNYSDNDTGSRVAVGDVWNVMLTLGKQRQIWVTEFNFRNGTCSNGEQTIVDYTRSLYNLMPNERAFYFSSDDGFTGTCGTGLLFSAQYNFAEKPVLYPGFKSIVSGH